MRDEVISKELATNIRGVRQAKNRDLVLTITWNNAHSERDSIAVALETKLGKENVGAVKNRPEGDVYIRDVEAVTNGGPVEVASMKPGFEGTQNAVSLKPAMQATKTRSFT